MSQQRIDLFCVESKRGAVVRICTVGLFSVAWSFDGPRYGRKNPRTGEYRVDHRRTPEVPLWCWEALKAAPMHASAKLSATRLLKALGSIYMNYKVNGNQSKKKFSMGELQDLTGMTRPTCKSALETLVEMGFVELQGQRVRSFSFLPAPVAVDSEPKQDNTTAPPQQPETAAGNPPETAPETPLVSAGEVTEKQVAGTLETVAVSCCKQTAENFLLPYSYTNTNTNTNTNTLKENNRKETKSKVKETEAPATDRREAPDMTPGQKGEEGDAASPDQGVGLRPSSTIPPTFFYTADIFSVSRNYPEDFMSIESKLAAARGRTDTALDERAAREKARMGRVSVETFEVEWNTVKIRAFKQDGYVPFTPMERGMAKYLLENWSGSDISLFLDTIESNWFVVMAAVQKYRRGAVDKQCPSFEQIFRAKDVVWWVAYRSSVNHYEQFLVYQKIFDRVRASRLARKQRRYNGE